MEVQRRVRTRRVDVHLDVLGVAQRLQREQAGHDLRGDLGSTTVGLSQVTRTACHRCNPRTAVVSSI